MNIASIKRKFRKSRMWKEDAFVVAILAIGISYLFGVDVLYGVAAAVWNVLAFTFVILVVYGPTIGLSLVMCYVIYGLSKL